MKETRRLILRHWRDADAAALYQYAADPRIGDNAGWVPHPSEDYSRTIIRTVFAGDQIYAIVPKQEYTLPDERGIKPLDYPVGSIGLTIGSSRARGRTESEGEIGYWIGVPYWGQGMVPEAVQEMIRIGFEELHLSRIWCCYYDGNERSRRVMEKCGFVYDHTNPTSYNPMLQETRIEHFCEISFKNWVRKPSF